MVTSTKTHENTARNGISSGGKADSAGAPDKGVGCGALVRVRDLWVGDRFMDGGVLWTNLGATGDGKHATARRHDPASIKLGDRGHGYIGDAICSFTLSHRVRFQPPSHPNVSAQQRPTQ